MTTQTIVDSNSIALSSAPNPRPGVINPSRSITKDDEAYLRDYTLAAQVISWDEGVFNTSLQVTAADITNICISGDTVWYQINYYRGIPLNIEIFHAHRQRIQLHKAQLDAQEQCQPQEEPLEKAGDDVRSSLQSEPKPLKEPLEKAGDDVSCQQQPEPLPQDEPLKKAADAVSCQLQLTQEDLEEFEIGRRHGQHDAAARERIKLM